MTRPQLTRCSSCDAFVPTHAARCPHCRFAVPTWVLRAAALLGTGAVAMTLSACYGAPCASGGRECYAPTPDPTAACDEPSRDLDRDGYCGEADCDEGDPDVQACPPR